MNFYLFWICILLYGHTVLAQDITLDQQCEQLIKFSNKNGLKYSSDPNAVCGIKYNDEYNNGITIVLDDKGNIAKMGIRTPATIDLDYSDFNNLPYLGILGLYNMKVFNTFPSQLMFPSLKEIYISGVPLDEVPKELENLKSLERLSIADGNIREFPYNLKTMPNLNYIFIKNSKTLKGKLEDLRDFKNLRTLYFENDALEGYTELPPTLTGLSFITNNIEEPDLLFEKITTDPNLVNLEELYLTGNGINIIPKSISNLSKLQLLHLDNNKISVLPKELFSLKNLTQIKLSNNLFKTAVLDFDHKMKVCELNNNDFCYVDINQCSKEDQVKEDQDKKDKDKENQNNLSKCTDQNIKDNDERLKYIYSNNNINKSNTAAGKNNEQNQKDDESFFAKNKVIIISSVIAVILLISFLAFFCFNKNNKDEPVYIKDDNNATYAYSTSEKSRRIIDEFNLSKSEIKPEEINSNSVDYSNALADKSQSNINPGLINNNVDNSMITNENYNSPMSNPIYDPNNINNNNVNNINTTQPNNLDMNNSVNYSSTSPVINNVGVSSPLINNNMGIAPVPLVNNNMVINNNTPFVNNMGINVPLYNMGVMNNIPMQANMMNNMPSSSVYYPPKDEASSSMLSKKKLMLLQESNNQLDEEQAKLQAKIRKEMLATEEMLINKKSKGGDPSYKDDEFDEPPPSYTQF